MSTTEVDRIIKVDHAGEYGAIHIYRSQLMIAKRLYPDIAAQSESMLTHERSHFETFDRLLAKRGIRHCYALRFWAFGGASLGLFTALLGRNAIWVCTYSIESTVLHHLEWQLAYLEEHDTEAHTAVQSIKADEESHQSYGQSNGRPSWLYKPIFWLVRHSTEAAIWLSTKL